MADVETPVESSPTEAPEPQPEVGPMSVPTDPEAYAIWRETGELPAKPSKKDDSAPSKSSAEKSGKDAPVSETGDQKQERRDNAQTRKEELNREIRELLAHRDQLRREVELTGKKDVKAEPSPAPAKDPAKRPEKPKQEQFKTWEEFEAAQDQYLEDLTEWKASQIVEKRETQRQQETAQREMQARLDEAKSRYGDEAEPKIIETAKTVFDDKEIAPAIKIALGRSAVLVDALYVMGSDSKELTDFVNLAKKDPLEALRKWFVVEAFVKEELGKTKPSPKNEEGSSTPPRGADGKFLSDKPARKTAPAPATELNGNSGPPGDEAMRAAERGDFRTFKAVEDRKAMLRWKGEI